MYAKHYQNLKFELKGVKEESQALTQIACSQLQSQAVQIQTQLLQIEALKDQLNLKTAKQTTLDRSSGSGAIADVFSAHLSFKSLKQSTTRHGLSVQEEIAALGPVLTKNKTQAGLVVPKLDFRKLG